MRYRVTLLPQATRDYRVILRWIQDTMRSPAGAAAWFQRWNQVLRQLETTAGSHALAPEGASYDVDIHEVHFKTRRGNVYRALYTIQGDQVFVMHIRGPGQDFVSPDELAFPD
jgi:plasmid stabilization system protein ParE